MSPQTLQGAAIGFLVGVAVSALVAVGWSGIAPRTAPEPAAPSPAPLAAAPATAAAPKTISQLGPIQPGEILLVQVFEFLQPGQWTRLNVRIDDAGNGKVSIAGETKFAGLSLSQAETAVAALLIKEQILPAAPPPQVEVFRLTGPDGALDPRFLLPSAPPVLH